MTPIVLLWLLLGLAMLYFGAEGLVRGSASLALRLGVAPLLVGLTVVAFGTSAPELIVSINAARLGQSGISVGNVVGSNICNIGLILGCSALLLPVKVASQIVRVDTPIMFGTTILAIALLFDGSLSRTEGVLLFLLFVLYIAFTIRLARKQPADPLAGEFSEEVRISKRGVAVDLLMVAAGLVMLVFGARWLVDSAISIAKTLGVGEAVIGLTIVAVGTSLPEFATSLIAALKKEADIAIGNLIGSNIFNILGILGISSIITPLRPADITGIDLGVMAGFAMALWFFSRSGHRIARIEGAFFILAYAGYLAWLVTRAG